MYPQCLRPHTCPFLSLGNPRQIFQSTTLRACAQGRSPSPTARHLRPRFLRHFFALAARRPLIPPAARRSLKVRASRVTSLASQTTCCVSGNSTNSSRPSLRRVEIPRARTEMGRRTRMAVAAHVTELRRKEKHRISVVVWKGEEIGSSFYMI